MNWWTKPSFEPGFTNGGLVLLGLAVTVAALLVFGWVTHWRGPP